MNIYKYNRILKRQNAELSDKLKQANLQLEELQNASANPANRTLKLTAELEEIKSAWQESIAELDAQRKEYNDLISQIQKCRDGMVKKSHSFFHRFFK